MKFIVVTLISAMLSILPGWAAGLFIESESFREKGGWALDQQFMDQMGSPYLLAHGMGRPVEDAKTTIDVPDEGIYYIFVRTFNWTSPWFSGKGPGKFYLKVNGKRTTKDALGCQGSCWEWQSAGKTMLKKGQATLALCDLTGFDGRCDAIYLTTDPEDVPPSEATALAAFRRKALGLPESPSGAEDYDLVVVGGGVAGMCAAVSAARLGCKVALVNDRPVLGGNNSSEIRVHLGGRIEVGPHKGLGRMIREFGQSRQGNAQPAANYEDGKKQAFIEAEKNVTLYPNCHAVRLMTGEGGSIKSVIVSDIETGRETLLSAPLFADCTGDGVIGLMAGADHMSGREARSDFGESLAPEKADSMVMGASVQWYSEDTGRRTSFPEFNYGLIINEDNCEKTTRGEWKWETGMDRDQISEAERIRDYSLLVIYTNWSFLKNGMKNKTNFTDRDLAWVAFLSGKRESVRLVGDYILKQDDIDKQVFHEDASFTTTWDLDIHFPDSLNSSRFPGGAFKSATVHNKIYPYAVPYRCLYSRNIPNLFMAGRDISVTHVALGSVRVMRTCGMMGEVVGMAASICKEHSALPRDVYRYYLPELRTLMDKGTGKMDVPDNQKFNQGETLDAPLVTLRER